MSEMSTVLLFKMITVLPLFTFQHFMMCYLYGTLNEKVTICLLHLIAYSIDYKLNE